MSIILETLTVTIVPEMSQLQEDIFEKVSLSVLSVSEPRELRLLTLS